MNHTTIKFALIGSTLISLIIVGFADGVQADGVINSEINAITGFNDTIFAGTPKGLFVSFNNGAQWNLADFSGREVTALEFDGENLYTAIGYIIYRSIDKGKTWSKIETSQSLQPCMYVLSLLKHQDKLFVGLDDCNPFSLKENDTAMNVIIYNDEYVTGFHFLSKDSLLFIASDDLFRSYDDGITLQKITPTSLTDSIVTFTFLAKSENAIFASCNKGIYRSTDMGNSWNNCTPVEFSASFERYYTPIAHSGNVLLAGASPCGIIRSTDNGTTWLKADSGPNGEVCIIAAIGTSIFAGTKSDGIFRSNDSGKTWQCVNTGLVTKATAVKKHFPAESFAINTIQHSTIISVTVAQPQTINADILSLSGRRIASLVHVRLTSGSHQFIWNDNRQNSGCYIVRLQIGENIFTKSILKIQ